MAKAKRIFLKNDSVRSLPFTNDGQRIIRDTRLRGFYVVVGKTSITYMAAADTTDVLGRKKTIRVSIGDAELVDAEKARNQARLLVAQIKAGDYRPPDREKPREVTLRQAFDKWMDRKGRDKSPATIKQYRTCVEDVLTPWLDVPLRNLAETAEARELVEAEHKRITEQRGPYLANRAFGVLRLIYKDARGVFDGLPNISPCASVIFNTRIEGERICGPRGVLDGD